MADVSLRLPFNGDYPISFGFGDKPSDEAIKKKYEEWGLVGHNGLDYLLPEGTDVIAADTGKIIQFGDNGDFGISVTIQHTWGQSLYGHLQETKVSQDQEVKAGEIIGLSGKTGFLTGPHLHFGIKPNNADENNGYLGFINPSLYFQNNNTAPVIAIEAKQSQDKPTEETSPQPQSQDKPTEQPKAEPKPPEEKPQQSQTPEPKVIEKEVIKEVVKEVVKEVPVVNQNEVNKQVAEKIKAEQDERRKLANEARTQKKQDNLNKILEFVKEKKTVTNDDIRDLLHVSQSTATNYLSELVNRGMLKREGEHGAAKYTS